MVSLPPCLTGAAKGSFAYETVKERWPRIVTKVIDTIHRQRHTAVASHGIEADKDIKSIVHELSEMRYQLMTDKPLVGISDSLFDAHVYNGALEQLNEECESVQSWFKSPWLFTECYLYRRIVGALAKSHFMANFDPFAFQKETAFVSSLPYMVRIGGHLDRMIESHEDLGDDEKRKTVLDLLQISLWGNRADLSISAGDNHETHSGDPLEQIEEMSSNILVNDLDRAGNHLSNLQRVKGEEEKSEKRVDFVLDNAGLELFADLCLAEMLIYSKLADRIVFHVKSIPWFVSDVTGADFVWTTEMLRSSQDESLAKFGHRWNERIECGEFCLETHPFWTYPFAYWDMENRAPDLYANLSASSLVIFKGDLNYRKLLGDVDWPLTTPFPQALQSFCPPTELLVLRTCKAELAVGFSQDTIRRLEKQFGNSKEWLVTGHYALVQIHGSTLEE